METAFTILAILGMFIAIVVLAVPFLRLVDRLTPGRSSSPEEEAAAAEDYERRLRNPRFAELESHFEEPLPAELRSLYENTEFGTTTAATSRKWPIPSASSSRGASSTGTRSRHSRCVPRKRADYAPSGPRNSLSSCIPYLRATSGSVVIRRALSSSPAGSSTTPSARIAASISAGSESLQHSSM